MVRFENLVGWIATAGTSVRLDVYRKKNFFRARAWLPRSGEKNHQLVGRGVVVDEAPKFQMMATWKRTFRRNDRAEVDVTC